MAAAARAAATTKMHPGRAAAVAVVVVVVVVGVVVTVVEGVGRRRRRSSASHRVAEVARVEAPSSRSRSYRRRIARRRRPRRKTAEAKAKAEAKEAAAAAERKRLAEETERKRSSEAAAAVASAKAAEAAAEARRREEEAQARAKAEAEAAEALRTKLALRASCAPSALARADEEALSRLDSSLKKVTPFLKKVRERLGEESRASLVAEAAKLNLSKYVEEVALGLAESRLKPADLPAALDLACAMHRAYAGFEPSLAPLLYRNATLPPPGVPPPPPAAAAAAKPGAPPPAPEPDAERTLRLTRRRSSLRLLFDLIAVGVLGDAKPTLDCLDATAREDSGSGGSGGGSGGGGGGGVMAMANLAVVSHVAKAVCTDPLLMRCGSGGGSAESADAADAAADAADAAAPPADADGGAPSAALSAAEEERLRGTLARYYGAACSALDDGYTLLRSVERANQKALAAKGELSDEASAAYDKARRAHERLIGGCATLADALGAPPPSPTDRDGGEEAVKERVVVEAVAAEAPGGLGGADGDGSPYTDAEGRDFYEKLPDLRAVLPQVLFAAAAPAEARPAGDEAARQRGAIEADLKRMLHLSGRAADVDEIASEIVAKGARSHLRLLLRHLACPPQSARHTTPLLPSYARLGAILSSCFKGVATELPAVVLEEYEAARAAAVSSSGGGGADRGGGDLSAALHLATYVGELAKFRLVSAAQVFGLLKQMLDAFGVAHIHLCCALLESCGRVLYYDPETRPRCEGMLSTLSKLRAAHKLPYELASLIDNTVYGCKPPERAATFTDGRPPLLRYIEHLIHSELSKDTLEKVARQLRKLPWRAAAAKDGGGQGWRRRRRRRRRRQAGPKGAAATAMAAAATAEEVPSSGDGSGDKAVVEEGGGDAAPLRRLPPPPPPPPPPPRRRPRVTSRCG